VKGQGGEGLECCGVQKTSLKYTLVKGAIPHREPSLLSTIALIVPCDDKSMETSLKSLDMLKLLIIIRRIAQYYVRSCGLLLLLLTAQ